MEIDGYEIDDLFDGEDFESVERKIDVQKHIEKWTVREKQILYLMACGHTQAEIGEITGLSQQHISRLLSKMSKRGE